MVMLTIFGRG